MNQWTSGVVESMNQRTNESMTQWIDDSANQRINEPMDQWFREAMNQWTNAAMNQWIHGYQQVNEWTHELLDGWMNGWMDGWMSELLLCWATSALNDLFAEVLLFSATTSLWTASYLGCSELPPSYLFCSFWKVDNFSPNFALQVPCLSHELKHLPSCDRVRVEEREREREMVKTNKVTKTIQLFPKKPCLPVVSSILVGPGRIGKHAAVHASVLWVLHFTCCIWSGWSSSCRCRRGRIF